ncbi:hypothetical protein D3C73_1348810 [compost metagenome]
MLAELQAEVAENAIEASNTAELNSPSLKVRLKVCGMRWVRLPLSRTPGMPSNGSSRRSRRCTIKAFSSSNEAAAKAKAAPIAAIWWVARVPERKPPS